MEPLSRHCVFLVIFLVWLASSTRAVPSPKISSPSSDSCDCVCGVQGRMNRIVGGKVTAPNDQPWMAGLWRQGKFYCGATVISRKYLLTAAHCTYTFDHREVRVYLGGHDIAKDYTEIRKIKAVEEHEYYDGVSFNNDIALIELDKPIKFGPRVQPACLPDGARTDFAGQMALIAGWGRTSEKGDTSRVLQSVKLPVWTQSECRAAGYSESRITDNMMCAGFKDGQKDACQGDSGGPMLYDAPSGSTEIIGIVSWGRGCARPNFPGLYTRVTNYLPWVKKRLSQECLCTPKNADSGLFSRFDFFPNRYF
ncbi:hypothetical protein ACFFRR_007020 [Megaselia abdita]